jgi:hypothetical protein
MEHLLTRSFLDDFSCREVQTSQGNRKLENLRLGIFRHIRFRKSSDITQGMLTFLTSTHRNDLPFVYAVLADSGEYRILFGLWGDITTNKNILEDSFSTVLGSIHGFFPGCQVERVQNSKADNMLEETQNRGFQETKKNWWGFLNNLTERRVITGIPTEKEPDKNKRQDDKTLIGLEELTDSTTEKFAVLLYAEPIATEERKELLFQTAQWHDLVHQYTKISTQRSQSEQHSHTDTWNKGNSSQKGTTSGSSEATSVTEQPQIIKRWDQNIKTFTFGGVKAQQQISRQNTEQTTESETITDSTGGSDQSASTMSQSMTVERTSKRASNLEEHLSRLHKRLVAGASLGLWRCTTEVYADNVPHADKVANLLCGVLSGAESSLDPLRPISVSATVTNLNVNEIQVRPDHPLGLNFSGLSTLLTSSELSMITRLPLHEISGLAVEKLTDYGRNWNENILGKNQKASISLGNLVDRELETRRAVRLGVNQLQRHCFVSGATGSGKSNTMRHLLIQLWQECHIPFLVIEPVKKEYRELQIRLGNDLRVFSLGSVVRISA